MWRNGWVVLWRTYSLSPKIALSGRPCQLPHQSMCSPQRPVPVQWQMNQIPPSVSNVNIAACVPSSNIFLLTPTRCTDCLFCPQVSKRNMQICQYSMLVNLWMLIRNHVHDTFVYEMHKINCCLTELPASSCRWNCVGLKHVLLNTAKLVWLIVIKKAYWQNVEDKPACT